MFVTVGVGVGSSVGDVVTVGVRVGEGVCVGSLVGDGAMVGVGTGASRGDALFCGWAIVLRTKSLPLLSESSPLPFNSSVPPILSDSCVDAADAFRSMLPSAAGVAAGEVSKSVALPSPTLSTIVTPLSLYRMSVLDAVMPLLVAV